MVSCSVSAVSKQTENSQAIIKAAPPFFSFFLTSRSWQKTVELPGLSPAMGAEESNSEMVHWKMFPPGNQIITESLKHFSDLNEYCVAELLREH